MERPDWVQEGVALAPLTTLGLGGPARCFASVSSRPQLHECLAWAAAAGVPVHLLGGGSNTVFADAGYDGLVVHLGLRGVAAVPDGGQVLVTAQAGEDWAGLVDGCVAQGWGGIECLAGIPGQAGATPVQNVGAYGQEVGAVLRRVEVLDRWRGVERELATADCGLGYRSSRFKAADPGRFVILAVTLALVPDARPQVRYAELEQRLGERGAAGAVSASGAEALTAVRNAVLDLRRRKSMVVDPADPESHSAGSFFLNPVLDGGQLAALRARLADPAALPVHASSQGHKVSAAWLVEQAGFPRGFQAGGVGVSRHHALALVNRGGSTTALLALVARIQAAVADRFGVQLQPEPVIVRASGGPARGDVGAACATPLGSVH